MIARMIGYVSITLGDGDCCSDTFAGSVERSERKRAMFWWLADAVVA